MVFIMALIIAAGAAECMCDSPVAAFISVACVVVMVHEERRLKNEHLR